MSVYNEYNYIKFNVWTSVLSIQCELKKKKETEIQYLISQHH